MENSKVISDKVNKVREVVIEDVLNNSGLAILNTNKYQFLMEYFDFKEGEFLVLHPVEYVVMESTSDEKFPVLNLEFEEENSDHKAGYFYHLDSRMCIEDEKKKDKEKIQLTFEDFK